MPSETKKSGAHTPGPWTVGDPVRSGTGRERHLVYFRIAGCGAVVAGTSVYVGETSGATHRIVDAEATANARLIAAAPELLFECRALLAWYDGLAEPGHVPAGLQPILRGARAAIAKATGEGR